MSARPVPARALQRLGGSFGEESQTSNAQLRGRGLGNRCAGVLPEGGARSRYTARSVHAAPMVRQSPWSEQPVACQRPDGRVDCSGSWTWRLGDALEGMGDRTAAYRWRPLLNGRREFEAIDRATGRAADRAADHAAERAVDFLADSVDESGAESAADSKKSIMESSSWTFHEMVRPGT